MEVYGAFCPSWSEIWFMSLRSLIAAFFVTALAALGLHTADCEQVHSATVSRTASRVDCGTPLNVAFQQVTDVASRHLGAEPPQKAAIVPAAATSELVEHAISFTKISKRFLNVANTALAHKALVVLLT